MSDLLHLPRDWMRKVRRAGREFLFPALDTRSSNLQVPPALFLDTLSRARPGTRQKLFRRLKPYLRGTAANSSFDVCEMKLLTDYESGYGRLAAMLGHAGKTPPPGELEFLREIVHRPMQYEGTISAGDNFFLTAFVSILAPERVIEIGTLTGFSAAIIAAALHRQAGDENAKWVDTIDLLPNCLIDETRPTGFEIAESFPELASMIRLHIPHDSTVVSKLADPDELELAFVDANHQHPLPLLDLLRLAPSMKRGGWIVLHDIRLATEARQADPADPRFRWGVAAGAELLFESWPFRKISGGYIGAVQLPEEKSALIPFALRLMSAPYEIKGRSARVADKALHESFEALL